MIFVTGGTGFLGSHLLVHLLDTGRMVRAIRRKGASFDIPRRVFRFYGRDFDAVGDRIQWLEADITDIYSLEESLVGVSDVYHAAALVSFQPGDKGRMDRVNVEGTANLVNACLDMSIRKFCHVSSIAAIGRAENDRVIDEEVIWKASRRNSAYAVSKYGAEREVWRGMEEGLDAVIVNPSIILGPGEVNSGSTRLIRTVEKGLRFYTPGVNGFVDVRDVVKAMMLLMSGDITGERFIVSAENMAYKELFSIIARQLDQQEPAYRAGKWMSEAYWRIEYARSRLTGSKPLVTRETARTANNHYLYSSEKIRSALGFHFLTIEQSIRDACTYYLENK